MKRLLTIGRVLCHRKNLMLALLGLLFVFAAMQSLLWWVLLSPYHTGAFPEWLVGWNYVVELFCIALAVIGIGGSVISRKTDPCWRGIFALGLAAIVPTYILFKPLTSLDITYSDATPLTPYCAGWAVATALWVALGVALIRRCYNTSRKAGQSE